jgi:hypothetical protein
VAQPLGSLESGRPGTTFTTLSNRGLPMNNPLTTGSGRTGGVSYTQLHRIAATSDCYIPIILKCINKSLNACYLFTSNFVTTNSVTKRFTVFRHIN